MSKKVKHVLNVAARAVKGGCQAGRLRREGLIPSIVYSKGEAGKPLSVKRSEWDSLLKYEFNLVSLVEEGVEEKLALVKEIQHDPVKGNAIHVDFQEVKRDQVITSEIKIHSGHVDPVGLSQGGLLEQVIHGMIVACVPDLLPESVVVDVSKMNVGDVIHLKDVVLPEGVKAVGNPNQIVFTVEVPAAEEDAKPAAEGAAVEAAEGAAEPEVIGAKERAEKAAEKEAAKSGKGGEEAKKK